MNPNKQLEKKRFIDANSFYYYYFFIHSFGCRKNKTYVFTFLAPIAYMRAKILCTKRTKTKQNKKRQFTHVKAKCQN